MTTAEPLQMQEPQTPLRLGDIRLVDKGEWVLSRLAGKSVLHVGPTDSPCSVERAKQGRLLHAKLQGRCKELIGLDLDRKSIDELSAHCGITDILYGNAEQCDQIFGPARFDTIIAGDVIEHMNNVGLFFQAAHRALISGGELLVTVPNAFAIKRMLGAILLRQERNNPDHLYFFSLMTLQQAAWRFGYVITEACTFMYNAPEDRMNQRGNRGAKLLMRLLNNRYLADELAVAMRSIGKASSARG